MCTGVCVAVSAEGAMFLWGDGEFGQLNLGGRVHGLVKNSEQDDWERPVYSKDAHSEPGILLTVNARWDDVPFLGSVRIF